jgi:hypothetical protein
VKSPRKPRCELVSREGIEHVRRGRKAEADLPGASRRNQIERSELVSREGIEPFNPQIKRFTLASRLTSPSLQQVTWLPTQGGG